MKNMKDLDVNNTRDLDVYSNFAISSIGDALSEAIRNASPEVVLANLEVKSAEQDIKIAKSEAEILKINADITEINSRLVPAKNRYMTASSVLKSLFLIQLQTIEAKMTLTKDKLEKEKANLTSLKAEAVKIKSDIENIKSLISKSNNDSIVNTSTIVANGGIPVIIPRTPKTLKDLVSQGIPVKKDLKPEIKVDTTEANIKSEGKTSIKNKLSNLSTTNKVFIYGGLTVLLAVGGFFLYKKIAK